MTQTVEVPIHKYGAICDIDARRMERNRRNDGRTVKAAARLACYRLTKVIRQYALSEVSDRTLHYDEDFMRDAATVGVTVRAAHLPEWVETPFHIPSDLAHVKLARPDAPRTAP